MKLQPVYLVAAEPKPVSITRRWAILLVAASFALGIPMGLGCGYLVGKSAAAAKAIATDAELERFRKLARDAPIEDLLYVGQFLVETREISHSDDLQLWSGISRMCDEILMNTSLRDRKKLALAVATTIEKAHPPQSLDLPGKAAALRKLE